MGLLDQLFGNGQDRRKWLNETVDQFVPPELSGALQVIDMFNPVSDIGRAGQSAKKAADPNLSGWDRAAAGGDMLVDMASVIAPGAGYKLAGSPADDVASTVIEMLAGMGGMTKGADDAARWFGADEYGGIKAYHGGPHDFDKFSMDKIGTGEGAQAYGHGLYFAEDEGVARGYRDSLTQQNQSAAQRSLVSANGDVAAAIEDAKRKVALYAEKANEQDAPDLAHRLLQINKQKLADLESGVKLPGSVYEVNINADPADFLDWDAPLKDQPGVASKLGVRVRSLDEINDDADALFKRHGFYEDMPPEAKSKLEALQAEMDMEPGTMTGEQYYSGARDEISHLMRTLSGSRYTPEQSKDLAEKGIPGIKFKDQGSRGADGGTSNYVVFDENLISIVRKYGIAGAAAMLGVTAADIEGAMNGT